MSIYLSRLKEKRCKTFRGKWSGGMLGIFKIDCSLNWWFLTAKLIRIWVHLHRHRSTKHQYDSMRSVCASWNENIWMKHMMCVCKKRNLNVQTSFENANYHFTDKFSKNCLPNYLWMALASHSLNLTFAKTAKTFFCKNLNGSHHKNCFCEQFEHFYGPICKLFLQTMMQLINQSADDSNGIWNEIWLASHLLISTFAKTTKTIFPRWIFCITWTDFVHFYGPILICKLFLSTHCQHTIQSVSRWNILRLLKGFHPLTTDGSFSVRIIPQQVFNRMPRCNILHLLMLTMSKINGINAFQGTKLFRKQLDIFVWKNC